MKRIIGFFAIAGVAASVEASPLSQYNLIVFEDLNQATSEVDGRTFIGGSLISSNASNFAVNGSLGPYSGVEGLRVGGDINAQINVNNGASVRVDGDVMKNVNLNGGGTLYLGGSVVSGANVNGGAKVGVPSGAVTADVAQIRDELIATSAALGAMAPNSFERLGGILQAEPNAAGVAIFEIASARLNGQSPDFRLAFNGASSVIINVVGASVTLSVPPNLNGDFDKSHSSRILWNFVDATFIDMNSPWDGAVLAPLAELDMDNAGGINGSVAVRTLSHMDAEIRSDLYQGVVPAPGGAAMLAGVGLIAIRRRR